MAVMQFGVTPITKLSRNRHDNEYVHKTTSYNKGDFLSKTTGNLLTTSFAVKLWGQPFDGASDITGDLQDVGNITASGWIRANALYQDGHFVLDNDNSEVAENYVKTDGIILYNSKNSGNPPQAIQNKSMPAGLEFLVQYTKQFTTDQSGVQGALQGVHRNTSGKQYQIEKQSASTTVSDFLESFNGCKLREAKKKLWTVQCFYDEHRSIQLTGEDFRSYYDPYTMGDIDMDVAMDLDVHSATVRDKIDDLLWQLKGMGDINALEMLESGGFPGTERLKKVLRKKLEEAEQAAAQAQAAGLPPAMAGGGAPPVVQQAPTHLKDEQPAGIT